MTTLELTAEHIEVEAREGYILMETERGGLFLSWEDCLKLSRALVSAASEVAGVGTPTMTT